MAARDIDAGHRLGVQDDGTGAVGDHAGDGVADVVGVGEVDARLHARNDDVVVSLQSRVTRDVDPGADRARFTNEPGDMRPRGPVEQRLAGLGWRRPVEGQSSQ